MCSYSKFVKDYNNPTLTTHDVRRINGLNGNKYSKLLAEALQNGDIPENRLIHNTNAKYYVETSTGVYQVQKTINGKKIIVGRFKNKKTAEEIVSACIEKNWELDNVKVLIDLKRLKPKHYTCINGHQL